MSWEWGFQAVVRRKRSSWVETCAENAVGPLLVRLSTDGLSAAGRPSWLIAINHSDHAMDCRAAVQAGKSRSLLQLDDVGMLLIRSSNATVAVIKILVQPCVTPQ
jgi:hypothetical protein